MKITPLEEELILHKDKYQILFACIRNDFEYLKQQNVNDIGLYIVSSNLTYSNSNN